MTFRTIDDFKARAEFFPAGRIIPQRILKGPRWLKHFVTFGVDAWALPLPRGYLVYADTGPDGHGIWVRCPPRRQGPHRLQGNPYHPGKTLNWVFSSDGIEPALRSLNRAALELTSR